MKRLKFAALYFLVVPGQIPASVPVFSDGPHAPVRHAFPPGAVAEYPVAMNFRGLADNLAKIKSEPINFLLPNGGSLQMEIQRWTPVDGFFIDASGRVAVSPDAKDTDLSFDVIGGRPGNQLMLAVRKGRAIASLTGRFERDGQAWTIVDSSGQLVLRDRDTTTFPGEPPDFPRSELRKVATKAAMSHKRAIDRGGNVDIVFLHTANAVTTIGSEAAMNDLITGSVVAMVEALDSSQASRVRIHHVMVNGPAGLQPSAPVAYNESPGILGNEQRWYSHRTWARTNPAALAIRNAYDADLVVMLVGDTGYCGIAYTQRPDCGAASGEQGLCDVGARYADFAIAVLSTQATCDVDTATFAHEVGHQFGMEHDRVNGVAAPEASFPWSYGFAVDATARTIMAYEIRSGAFRTCPHGCPVQLSYSNPAVAFRNFPATLTGTAVPDGTGRTTSNAQTAVLYATAMEGFRGPSAPDKGLFGHGFEPLPAFVCNPSIWPNCP